ETVLAMVLPDTPKLLDPRERAETAARVSAAEAAVSRAQTNIDAALIAEETAASQFERIRRLRERDSSSEQALEDATMKMRMRQEEHRAAEFSMQIAKFELAQAQAALQRFDPAAQESSGADWHFEIRSPISGRVLRVLHESAAVLPAGTQLLELGDPANLELEVDVLSIDAVKIEPGDRIVLEHWGGEEPLTGVVKLVEPAAFTKISALGVEEQRVWIIGDLTISDAERARLGDAFRFEARIVVWEEQDVLQCPTAALFRLENEWAVYVLAADRAHLRKVVIGHRNADAAEILSGLAEGDRVIVYPSDRVQEAVNVVVRNGK
ncbi:MAG: HlyD family efflux transporter periplasmic adaptor subunit, partial [Planctomycetaceae bacterium]|nr:HlyD family efflux transporter periplasmic adaptor subunit [Planctomycetaceae bacterium]